MTPVHAAAVKNIKNAVGRQNKMKTIVEKIDALQPDMEKIRKAAAILQNGGLVAFPTETVYGLGGNGLDYLACRKIYEAKGRPSDNPLILHIGELDQLERIVSEVPAIAKKIMDAYWPGPVTIIFPKAACVPKEITGGFETVAVRFPSNPLARVLINAAGVPIAAPSANSSGKPSPTRASHVEYDLSGKIEMILDGGAADVGLESTIVDATGDKPCLLRPGAVTKEMLDALFGYEIDVDPAVFLKPDKNLVPKAPGMKYTHYSPKADVTLVRGEIGAVVEKINALAKLDEEKGIKVGIMATEETKDMYPYGTVLSVGERGRIETVGANLFKTLRQFDHLNMDVVYSEVFPLDGEGLAVMNRLNKAAGYKFIDV